MLTPAFEDGRCELERGRLREAIDFLQQAAEREGDRAEIETLLGLAFARARQIAQAFDHFERALELDADGFGPHCAIGELYLRVRVAEEARAHLERAATAAVTLAERAYVEELLRELGMRSGPPVRRPSFRQPIRRPGPPARSR